jgi:hypothetical protein
MPAMRNALWIAIVLAGCGGKKDEAKPAEVKSAEVKPAEPPAAVKATELPAETKPAELPAETKPADAKPPAERPETPAGPPPDGKYERVVIEGVTVPMIHVMEGGTVVLVDTDGKKPRTWEEQYKRKRATGKGQFDLHKTDVNRNGKFDDDPIDREGLWVIDLSGNLTKR